MTSPRTVAGPDTTPAPLWDKERLARVHAEPDKAHRVRGMFNAIAPTYALVNALFSLGRDRAWRRTAVRLAAVRSGDRVLDIACGTGDLLRAFARWAPQAGTLAGCDFAHGMLARAKATSVKALRWCEADALQLPFADRSVDVTSCAFGVRNFQDLDRGLAEMYRVLRPGGRAIILEFTRPANRLIRALHEFYAGRIMPIGATLVSRDRTGAYRYLPRSVVSFAGAREMADRLQRAGFGGVSIAPLTFGVVTIYAGCKEAP